jgi:hypothetical protein
MSRIGVARVEKRQELDGASLYTVHDFYALTGVQKQREEEKEQSSFMICFTGLDKARSELSQVKKSKKRMCLFFVDQQRKNKSVCLLCLFFIFFLDWNSSTAV